ncbi:LysM peptidoglycan-binding domain-containing protein [Wenzhouxiangella sediminis]|uniref:LysM peptidoglycan-binding domain-containing protein n=1 Tax=Wenzhouxiangella sediminis TaxID=1792836 RepID=A0A3E1K7Z9_9GAMM|nr:LysM peptidoglycan-binding domain-containing protein [Wenzhouxiangella sediminis]
MRKIKPVGIAGGSRSVKRLVFLTAIVLAAFTVQAQDVELREDHPREYVVQEGDTLWDIAGRFLTRPWQWPAIWDANPQIENPHLIYPGDVISLVFIDGEPRLMVNDSVRRLSPDVRREAIDGPISTIPLDAVETFLDAPRIVSAEEYEQLPYVIANNEQRVLAGPGDRTYVRGLDGAQTGDEVVLARVNYMFEDRSANPNSDARINKKMIEREGQVRAELRPASALWKSTIGQIDRYNYPVIGYELWETARGRVVRTGDPAIVEILSGRRETMEGDFVLPVHDHVYDASFHPRALDEIPEDGRVIAITGSSYGAGHYQVVAINLGTAQGIQAGHTFSAFRPGETIRDERYPLMSRAAFREPEKRYVDLPDEFAGRIMVFRPFEHVSYAIVLEGSGNTIQVDDVLAHPDRSL